MKSSIDHHFAGYHLTGAVKSYRCARFLATRSRRKFRRSPPPDYRTLDGASLDTNLLATLAGFVFTLRGELKNLSVSLKMAGSAVIAVETLHSIFIAFHARSVENGKRADGGMYNESSRVDTVFVHDNFFF